jgi:formate hydrogenlyase subunit 4
MSFLIKDYQSNVINDAGQGVYTVLTTGIYFVSTTTSLSVPVPPSSLVITIAQTGSASKSVSTTNQQDAQLHMELQGVFSCVAGDILTVTLVGTDPINTSKTVIDLYLQYQA